MTSNPSDPNLESATACRACGAPIARAIPGGVCARCAFQGLLTPLAPPRPPAGSRPHDSEHPRFLGDYELVEEIARGGMGVVYRARQLRLNRMVAVKVIHPSAVTSADFIERFLTEAETVASLDHPNIVPIHEIGEHEGAPYFSMRLIEGETLAQWVARTWSAMPSLPPGGLAGHAARMISRLAHTVHYAHQRGVLHRDLKPNNILLTPDGTPHLTDFGLAKLVERDSSLTRTAAVMGTPAYMSPEQARGDSKCLTTAADVYGLGAILYEMLAGRPPFQAGTAVETLRRVLEEDPVPPRRLHPEIDPDLELICLKCLEKDPARRYSSAEELARDLDRWGRGEPILARPAAWHEQLRKTVRRHPVLSTVILSAAVAVCVVAIVASAAAYRLHQLNEITERSHALLARHNRDLEWQKAEDLAASGNVAEALAYFGHFLRTFPDRSVPAARLRSMLSMGTFPLLRGEPLAHEGGITDVAFDRTGRRIASASQDRSLRIWDVGSQRLLARLEHPAPVSAIRVHPRDDALLTLCQDGIARLWHLGDLRVIREFPSIRPNIVAEFSPDGSLLALRLADNQYAVFDTQTGEMRLGPFAFRDGLRVVAFTPDGREMMHGTWDGELAAIDLETGVTSFKLQRSNPIATIRFTTDGRRMIWGEMRRMVVWDRVAGAIEREIPVGDHEVIRIEISPDGKQLLALPYFEPAGTWDLETGDPVTPAIGRGIQWSAGTFSPDGAKFVTASVEGQAHVWDAATGAALLQPMQHDGPITALGMSPDGGTVATGSEDGSVRLWDIRMAPPRIVRIEAPGELREGFYSRDGRWVFTSRGPLLERHDAATGARDETRMEHGKQVFMAVLSPDGRTIAAAPWDATARLWDPLTGAERTPPLRHHHQVTFLRFSPGGRRLATTCSDFSARLWNPASGEPLTDPIVHPDNLVTCDFTPDGSLLVTGCFDGGVRAFSVPEGRHAFQTEGHQGRVWAVRARGGIIASASSDRTVRLWDASTGTPIGRPIRHERGVLSVEFDADGGRIVTATEDGVIRVWDVRTQRPLSQPMLHAGAVWLASFSADGRRIVAGCAGGVARIWDAETGYALTDPLRHGGHVVRTVLSPDGSRLLTTATDDIIRFFDVPDIRDDAPAWLAELAEAIGGKRLNDFGELEPVPLSRLQEIRRRILSTDASGGFHDRWARWFLLERIGNANEPR